MSGRVTVRPQPHYVLASETCALDIIGAEYTSADVDPGELVWITHEWDQPRSIGHLNA